MGLDQYAYAAAKAADKELWWETAKWDESVGDYVAPATAPVVTELAYWRKHPGLQGHMERLWDHRGCLDSQGNLCHDDFNGVEIELTLEDLESLERLVLDNDLPHTTGFFFGSMSNDEYREEDLAFITKAREAIANGNRVFYNSSW